MCLPIYLCRFRVRSYVGLFPGTATNAVQSDKDDKLSRSVTIHWPRNINLVPISYAFRPRLRGRLTLLRLALSRNPWTFGESVSHTLCRYSCQHSHFRYLQSRLPFSFTGLRNAPLPIIQHRAVQNSPDDRSHRREQNTARCLLIPKLRLVA